MKITEKGLVYRGRKIPGKKAAGIVAKSRLNIDIQRERW
jgi:hypothetical protein